MSIDEEIDELKKKIVSLEALLPIVSEAERIAIRQQIAGTSNEKAALTIIKGQHDGKLTVSFGLISNTKFLHTNCVVILF